MSIIEKVYLKGNIWTLITENRAWRVEFSIYISVDSFVYISNSVPKTKLLLNYMHTWQIWCLKINDFSRYFQSHVYKVCVLYKSKSYSSWLMLFSRTSKRTWQFLCLKINDFSRYFQSQVYIVCVLYKSKSYPNLLMLFYRRSVTSTGPMVLMQCSMEIYRWPLSMKHYSLIGL